MQNKTIVIHWCGVINPWKSSEWLSPEWKLRVFSALRELEEVSPWSGEVEFYLTGWLAQANLWQKSSEATHMKSYLKSKVKEFFPSLNIKIVEESESTDTFENISNVVQKTKQWLLETLRQDNTWKIIAYTSDYHTWRVWVVRKNALRNSWIPQDLLKVISADKVSFNDSNLQTEYLKVLADYTSMRKNRTLWEKAKWYLTEIVWRTFAHLWLDKLLSKIHEKFTHRKKIPTNKESHGVELRGISQRLSPIP